MNPITFGLEDFNVGTEALRYEHYYRKHGIRTFKMLLAPRFSSLENLELPLKSVLHYLPESVTELGILPTNVFVRKASGIILVHHVSDLVEPEGTPMLASMKVTPLTLQYRKSARSIRPMRSYETAFRSDKTLVVENYCFLNHLYRYRNTYMARVFKFRNLINAFIAKTNELAEISDRKQYVELKLPKTQITLQKYVMGGKRLSRQTLAFFPDDQSMILLELWKWLGEKREDSIFSKLTPKAIESLQFVVIETGKYVTFSLDLLNKARRVTDGTEPELTDGAAKRSSQTYSPKQVQLAYYKFLNTVYEVRNVANKSVIEIREGEDGEEKIFSIGEDGQEVEIETETAEDIAELDAMEETEMVDDNEEIEVDFDLTEDENPDLEQGEIYIPDDTEVPKEEVIITELSHGVQRESAKLLEMGLISAASHKRNEHLATSYKRIPNPWGLGTLENAITIDPATLVVEDKKLVPDISYISDKSMLKSSIRNFDKDYVAKVMNADIASMVVNLQKTGAIIHDYKVEEKQDANNHYDIHVVQWSLVGGKVSTARFRINRVSKDGTFRSRGTNYRLRKQRVDIPIRKTGPNEVGLTSYVSKVFVTRSEKKVNDYGEWLRGQTQLLIEKGEIKHTDYADVGSSTIKVPRGHAAIATRYRSFSKGKYHFYFDINKFLKENEADTKAWLADGFAPCGYLGDNILLMDSLGVVYVAGKEEPEGSIEEVLGIVEGKVPVDLIVVKVLDKQIPISVIMAYHLGLTNYLKSLRAPYRIVVKGAKLDLMPDEFAIKFADQTLIVSRTDQRVALSISGFLQFKNSIAKYPMMEFDSPDVYGAVFDLEGMGGRYLRELNITEDLWVDPITRGILESRNEPTEWLQILRYAIELLTDDTCPREGAGSKRRTRGYERISGHVYSELVRSVRKAKTRPITANVAIELNPNAVHMRIQSDPSVGIVNELNPIEELKEVELLTFGGTGGRSGRTMVHSTRAFDPDDLGTVSEAGVDNANVAVITYSTPDPTISDLRGMRKEWEVDYTATAKLLSTPTLISAGATHDDMKRAVFNGVQQSHVVSAVGYEVSALQTGYESMIAHRTSEMYSYVVDAPATLVSVGKDHIVVEYDDPDRPIERVAIGRRYGVSTGHVIAHDLICDVPEGTKLKPGHVVVYNTGFFARSFIDPTQVIWKTGMFANIALIDDADTLEDSSAIGPRLASGLTRPVCDYREVTLRFDQGISDLIKVGADVEVDTILCNIEDSVTAGGNLFDADTRDSLKLLARNTPKADTVGRVAKIEVLYCGDTEEMSESILTLVNAADKERTRFAKSMGSKVLTGSVSDLDLDTVKIGIYIDRSVEMSDGDKCVFCNQLKSVVKRVMTGTNETVSGIPLDAKFGNLSVDARMVGSPGKTGTAIVLVELANQRAATAYRNK